MLFHGEAALEAGRAEEAAKALRRFRGLLLPARWEAWARPSRSAVLASRSRRSFSGSRSFSRSASRAW